MSDTDKSTDETARDDELVTLAHGAGAGSMRSLVDEIAISRFTDDDAHTADEATLEQAGAVGLSALDDGAAHPLPGGDRSVVVTTDSHVVTPPVFPGGDIGRLAVAGTVNDLAVMGAVDPLALTCSLVVEEGFPVPKLESLMDSVQETCEEAGVQITTGDTKVMGSGEVDGPVINTTGIGLVPMDDLVPDAGLSPGDSVVVTGTVGDHGLTLLSEREGFGFEGDLTSDVAPVNDLVGTAMAAGSVTAMKDPTRGGLSTALNEMATKGGVGLAVDETAIPVDDTVAAAGEVLGIDPYDIANEGKAILGVDHEDADAVLDALRSHPQGREAAVIGRATAEHTGRVVLDTGFGSRYLSEPEGQNLPRIC